jgi:hypothetical protein
VNIIRCAVGTGASVGAAVVILAAAGAPAAAHVKVDADNPQSGARDVTVRFTAEAESETAGIVSLTTVLPNGVAPDDVSLVSGPRGWKFRATADGFKVSGDELPVGKDAKVSVKFAKLPKAAKLPLKTVERYADGESDRWDDTSKSVERQEPNAAPVVVLRAAAPAAPAQGNQARNGTTVAKTAPAGLPTIVWVGVIVAAAGAIGAVLWLRGRRRRPSAHWS